MLVIWRGWGILVPFIFFGLPALGEWAIDGTLGQGTYLRFASVLSAIFWLMSAALVWFIGRKLNRRDTPEATSNFQVAHSFMILRMEYWAAIFVVAAIAAIVI